MSDLHTRIRAAYTTAMSASNDSANVSIHVGSEIWDALLEMAKKVSGLPLPERGDIGLLWGFPLIEEKAWEPNAIQVRTTRIIY